MSDRPDLDFTSDNVAGASPQVMQPCSLPMPARRLPMADEITARVTRPFRRSVRARGCRRLRANRHGRERAGGGAVRAALAIHARL